MALPSTSRRWPAQPAELRRNFSKAACASAHAVKNELFDVALTWYGLFLCASLDAACQVLRGCEKIDHIYVAALTWTRNQ